DRGKPLWEMWVVEGLDENRFAIITKAHHCMIDGVGSVELMSAVMRPTPEDEHTGDPVPQWYPRPAPSPAALFARELYHRASAPLDLLRLAREAAKAPREVLPQAAQTASGFLQAMTSGFNPASPTPFNVPI